MFFYDPNVQYFHMNILKLHYYNLICKHILNINNSLGQWIIHTFLQ